MNERKEGKGQQVIGSVAWLGDNGDVDFVA